MDLSAAWIGARSHGSTVWERLETTAVNIAARTISARVPHFSDIAIFSSSGGVAGRGDHFVAGDIELESSAPIDLTAYLAPAYGHLSVLSAAIGTELRVRGLLPHRTYYLYRDSLEGPPMSKETGGSGHLSFTTDVEAPFELFIQPQRSTKHLPRQCADIGTPTFDANNRPIKCTLTTPVFETIEITPTYCPPDLAICLVEPPTPSGYELDCAGNTIKGAGTANGWPGSSPGVLLAAPASSIKNCTIESFFIGIDFTGLQTFRWANPSGGVIENVHIVGFVGHGMLSLGHVDLTVRKSDVVSSLGSTNYSIYNFGTNELSGWQLVDNELGGQVRIESHLRSSSIRSELKTQLMTGVSIQTAQGDAGETKDVDIFKNAFRPDARTSWAVSASGTQRLGVVQARRNHVDCSNGARAPNQGGLLFGNVSGGVAAENTISFGCGTGVELADSTATVRSNQIVGNDTGLVLVGATSPIVTLNDLRGNRLNVASGFAVELSAPDLNSPPGTPRAFGNYWGVNCPGRGSFGPVLAFPPPPAITDKGAWGVPIALDTLGLPPVSAFLAVGPPGCQLLDTDGDGFTPAQGDCDDRTTLCHPGNPNTCIDADTDQIPQCLDCDDHDNRCTNNCTGRVARHLFNQ
ncbi:MAG: hypothetical protein IT381_15960 [Deltaproteobacteria bacterium]|nr:hypothetical protein [Deltaproteobacteria bacterium]